MDGASSAAVCQRHMPHSTCTQRLSRGRLYRTVMAAMPSGVLLPVLVTGAVLGLTVVSGMRRCCSSQQQQRQQQKRAKRGASSDFYDSIGNVLNWPSSSLWFNWGFWRLGSEQTYSNAAEALCSIVHGCVAPETNTLIGKWPANRHAILYRSIFACRCGLWKW